MFARRALTTAAQALLLVLVLALLASQPVVEAKFRVARQFQLQQQQQRELRQREGEDLAAELEKFQTELDALTNADGDIVADQLNVFAKKTGSEDYYQMAGSRLVQLHIEYTPSATGGEPTVVVTRNVYANHIDSEVIHKSVSVEGPDKTYVSKTDLFVLFKVVCNTRETCLPNPPTQVNPVVFVARSYALVSDGCLLQLDAKQKASEAAAGVAVVGEANALLVTDATSAVVEKAKASVMANPPLADLADVYISASRFLAFYARWCNSILAGNKLLLGGSNHELTSLEEVERAFVPARNSMTSSIHVYRLKFESRLGENTTDTLERMENAITGVFESITKWSTTMKGSDLCVSKVPDQSVEANVTALMRMALDAKLKERKPGELTPEGRELITTASEAGSGAFVDFMKDQLTEYKKRLEEEQAANPQLTGYYASQFTMIENTKAQLNDKMKETLKESLVESLSSSGPVTDVANWAGEQQVAITKGLTEVGDWFSDAFKGGKAKKDALNKKVSTPSSTPGIDMASWGVGEKAHVVAAFTAMNGCRYQQLEARLDLITPTTNSTASGTRSGTTQGTKVTNSFKFKPGFKLNLKNILESINKIELEDKILFKRNSTEDTLSFNLQIDDPFKAGDQDFKVSIAWNHQSLTEKQNSAKVEVIVAAKQDDPGKPTEKKTLLMSVFAGINRRAGNGAIIKTGLFASLTVPFTKSNGHFVSGAPVVVLKPNFEVNFANSGSTKIVLTSELTFSKTYAVPHVVTNFQLTNNFGGWRAGLDANFAQDDQLRKYGVGLVLGKTIPLTRFANPGTTLDFSMYGRINSIQNIGPPTGIPTVPNGLTPEFGFTLKATFW